MRWSATSLTSKLLNECGTVRALSPMGSKFNILLSFFFLCFPTQLAASNCRKLWTLKSATRCRLFKFLPDMVINCRGPLSRSFTTLLSSCNLVTGNHPFNPNHMEKGSIRFSVTRNDGLYDTGMSCYILGHNTHTPTPPCPDSVLAYFDRFVIPRMSLQPPRDA